MSAAAARPRVVSLIASATEIVAALGHGPNLVGRSHECDFPPEVLNLPVVTEPRFAVTGTSAEIDASVRASLADALSVYRVDRTRLEDLAPTVVVTQDQCEVCAVSLADVEMALADWTSGRPRLVSLKPDSLDDVWSDIARIADALDASAAGAALVLRLKQRIAAIGTRPCLPGSGWLRPIPTASW